jgi:neurotransmitter:Na+ symporter, NSS family
VASKSKVQWSSKTAFLLAAVGSAVGLGNIWRFPYLAGENGGSAFVLVYVGFVFLIGIPVLLAELTIGRRGGMSPIGSVRKIALESGLSKHWDWLGRVGTFGGGLGLLSFYSVIAGWVMAYIIQAAIGAFSGITAVEAQGAMQDYSAHAGTMTFWHFAFTGITVFIVGKGIQGGLEKAVTYLMPALFLLLLLMVGYSMATAEFGKAVEFLFTPDFSKINSGVVLTALGQAFFSLSVTVGTMFAYGAYLPKDVSLHKSAILIASADTAVALLAGLAIFPLVFAYGLSPDSGPTLIFVTLPIAFGQMPGGAVIGTAFFVLLTIAAITSSISLLEPAVAWFEERFRMKRWYASLIGGGIAFLVGMLTLYSNNDWAELVPLSFVGIETVSGKIANWGNLIDFFVSNMVMPISGFMIAIFAGWFVKRDFLKEEMGLPEGGIFEIWHVLIKYVVPLALGYVIFMGLK